MKNLILIGAGASFGSGPCVPSPPPLGAALFDELVRLGGVFARVPQDIASVFRSAGFEQGMAVLMDRGGVNFRDYQLELGAYFCAFKPEPQNQFFRLADALGDSRAQTVVASLNYDLLLERAALEYGYSMSFGPGRTAAAPSGHFQVLKLHGSSNFWPGGQAFNSNVFSNIVAIDCDVDIETMIPTIKHPADACSSYMNNPQFGPIIAVYAAGKPTKSNPAFLRKLQRRWADDVAKADQIFITGTAVVPADEHIWSPLASTNAHIHFFGFSAKDCEDFESWAENSPELKRAVERGDFAHALDVIIPLIEP